MTPPVKKKIVAAAVLAVAAAVITAVAWKAWHPAGPEAGFASGNGRL